MAHKIKIVLAASAGLAPATLARPDLHNNGPFITHPGGGAGGADLSVLQTNLQNTSVGFSSQQTPGNFRLADDFTVPAGGWTLSSVVFFQFQTQALPTSPTIDRVYLRLWQGRPGDAGSVVVFGDLTTNRFVSATWASAYRARDDMPMATDRAIFRIEAAIDPPLSLPAGAYWLDWQTSGTLASGPFNVPVTILGVPGAPGANARVFSSGAWINLRDGTSNAPQELAFIVRGTTGTSQPCYANCDLSTQQPVLNVNDFICFQQRFAAADPYANCDGSTMPPLLNVNDFVCFQTRFAAGCSAP